MNRTTKQMILRDMVRGRLENLVLELTDEMDGQEWSADTLDALALVFERHGILLNDFDEVETGGT